MSFESLGLAPTLLSSIAQTGFTEPTPVQRQAIPQAIAGHDLMVSSQTGSGKTAAFMLPALNKLAIAGDSPLRTGGVRVLVLTPTRELALQVTDATRMYSKGMRINIATVVGGMPYGAQLKALSRRVDVLVATPGRLLDHVQSRRVDLSQVTTLVLDEADRMLDMGFYDSLAEIIQQTPSRRQTLLFSATYPESLEQLTDEFQRNPAQVRIEQSAPENPIEQRFYEIQPEQRFASVLRLLAANRPQPCIAFCHTRQQCQELADYLNKEGISAQALHGDMEQRERDQVLALFANQSCSVLTATDVAARGIDIAGVAAVINVELAADPAAHVHRIGRSGRAGQSGLALSLVAPRELKRLKPIEEAYGELNWQDIERLPERPDRPLIAPMRTLAVAGGRKDKLRPGDLLGALTGEAGLTGDAIGKISISDYQALVAIRRDQAKLALQRLEDGKIKGRRFKVRLI